MELRVLLLKGFHATLKMHLQPSAAMNGEELHSCGHVATFINTANDVSKGVLAASTKVMFGTGCTIVVGDVAGTKSELTNAILKCSFLKSVGLLLLKNHGLDNLFHILTPEPRAFFFRLVEGKLLGHANNLHIVQFNNLVFHYSYYFLSVS